MDIVSQRVRATGHLAMLQLREEKASSRLSTTAPVTFGASALIRSERGLAQEGTFAKAGSVAQRKLLRVRSKCLNLMLQHEETTNKKSEHQGTKHTAVTSQFRRRCYMLSVHRAPQERFESGRNAR